MPDPAPSQAAGRSNDLRRLPPVPHGDQGPGSHGPRPGNDLPGPERDAPQPAAEAPSGDAGPKAGDGLRVLTITNLYPTPRRPWYGTFIASQVESLRAEGVESDVYFIDGKSSRWEYVKALREVPARLRRGGYQIVHAHYGYSGVYPLLFHKVPVVVSFCGDDAIVGHEHLTWLKTRVREFVKARADAVIVKTREMKDALRLDRAHVIPNGVDLERFRPLDRTDCRRRLGFDPAERCVLFPYDPGRAVKGFDLASAAMEIVRRRIASVRLEVVWTERPETMPLYFNAADLLLFTSRREGSPNAVKEALACNLPVVAIPSGDLAVRIGGVRGCHLVEGSAEKVAEAILAVLSDPDPRSDGRPTVEPLGARPIAHRIIAIYKSLAA